MEKKIQGFQNEVNSLKQKLRKLENKKKKYKEERKIKYAHRRK